MKQLEARISWLVSYWVDKQMLLLEANGPENTDRISSASSDPCTAKVTCLIFFLYLIIYKL